VGGTRDALKRIGVLGSFGSTVSSFGIRLLDLRNEFGKIGEKKKQGRR
jgi:hypothetical protein